MQDRRSGRRVAAGDEQSRFRQTVVRRERVEAKSEGREGPRETLHRLGPDRLRAIRRDLPVAKIDVTQLGRQIIVGTARGKALDTQVVGEVRPTATSRPEAPD